MTGNCTDQPSKATFTYNYNYHFIVFVTQSPLPYGRNTTHTEPRQKKAMFAVVNIA